MSASIWDHYEKIPGKTEAKCILCKKNYSYKTSITNLKKHLNHKHLSAYQNFINTQQTRVTLKCQPTSVSEQVEESSSSDQPVIKLVSPNIQTDPPGNLQQRIQQQAISATPYVSCKIDDERKQYIDKKLLQMIIQDYQPFSVVEDEGFRSFVEALNPGYELPNRKLISGVWVPGQYLECKSRVMELVQKAQKVCLTTDCWTSLAMDAYLAVTAHFLINFELKTVLLHCEHFSGSHTADALAAALKKITLEWEITEKISLVVSDNTASITSAIQETGWPFFGCFLHKLNLIIDKAMLKVEFILEKVKKVVSYFKTNNLATEVLVKYQIDFEKKSYGLGLIQSVPTRWNTVFYMLERFLKLQAALQAVVTSLKADLPIITVEMWEAIRQLCIILKLFEEITQIMSSTHYLTASLAIVIVDGLRNVISIMQSKPIFGVARDFLEILEDGMKTYFPENEIEDNMLLGICTFLDPRFKSHAFVEDKVLEMVPFKEMCQRAKRAYLIKEQIVELLKTKLRKKQCLSVSEIVQFDSHPSTSKYSTGEEMMDTESISIWGKIDQTIAANTPSVDDLSIIARRELDMFLKEQIVQRDSCPLAWWKSHAHMYPNLAELFTEYCHNVVTSVECERVFSKEGNFKSHKRARLVSRKHTSELVFLHCNEVYCK